MTWPTSPPRESALHRVPWPTSPAPMGPVSIDEAKEYARITHDTEDAVVEMMLAGAVDYAETATRRTIALTLWDLVLDTFPCGVIELRRPPVLDIVSVQYRDADEAWVTMDVDVDLVIEIDGDYARIGPLVGASWPGLGSLPRSVRVRYRAGYRPIYPIEDVPLAAPLTANLQTGICELFAFRFDTRGLGSTNRLIEVAVPSSIDALFWSERVDL